MPFVHVVLLAVLCLGACKIRRLPALPAERDPVAPQAPVTDYEPPPDVLTTELGSGGSNGATDPHAGHHHGAEPTPAPTPAPTKGHEGHEGHDGGAP
jgi:hypothetical protein